MDMKESKFSIQKRIRSFGYAFNGLKILIQEEHNSRIHLLAAITVVASGFYFDLSRIEWVFVTFAIGLVFAFEIINSAIEGVADFISPEKHQAIKKIKDLSAAAVLVSAITAFIIGIIVFLPKIINI